jgi:hypothetical protein
MSTPDEDDGRICWRLTISRAVTSDEAEDVTARVLAALDDAPGVALSVTFETPHGMTCRIHEDAPEDCRWSCDAEGRHRRG